MPKIVKKMSKFVKVIQGKRLVTFFQVTVYYYFSVIVFLPATVIKERRR